MVELRALKILYNSALSDTLSLQIDCVCHFVDYFICYAEAFQFDTLSFVCFYFCCLCFWALPRDPCLISRMEVLPSDFILVSSQFQGLNLGLW